MNRTPKEVATVVEKIITEVNKKFKQNRNNYKDIFEDDKIVKKKSSFSKDISEEEKMVLKLKEKREAEQLREVLRKFKIERNNYVIRLCRENNISPDYIIRLAGFNAYDYL